MSVSSARGSNVRAVDRSLSILGALAAEGVELRLDELSARLRLPKSTIHRLLATLTDRGFVERTDQGAYRLGLTTALVGAAALRGREREALHSTLLHVRERTGETVGLATLEGTTALIVDRAVSPHPLTHNIQVGSRLPAHATSSGRALLAQLDDTEIERLYPPGATLTTYTARTVTSAAELRALIETVRERGYALDDQEFAEGLRCASVPVQTTRPGEYFAIGISGTAPRLSDDRLAGNVDVLHSAAREIATLLERR